MKERDILNRILAAGTNVAKKVAWCMLELFNRTMTVAGPVLELYTKKAQDEYLEKVKNCMKTKCSFSRNYAVAAQKLFTEN